MSDSNSKSGTSVQPNKYRSHSCNDLRSLHVKQTAKLCGWINCKRDHGSLLFIDLRDSYGITQCVLREGDQFFKLATELRDESVILVEGQVVSRSEANRNPKLASGEVELKVDYLEVISAAKLLPFTIEDGGEYPEEVRLTHRYLDLRRQEMQERMLLRSRIISKTRQLMEAEKFNEFQTPILTASSPEGARDFLVPSRLNPGHFYALPQAPQQFKQLVMLSGFERYFQIAPCFRDEDPRADRSPGDFYQLDVEMAYVEQDDVLRLMERVITNLFTAFDAAPATKPFPRLTYAEAIQRYGIDKPDLRIKLELANVTEVFKDSELQIFSKAIANGAQVVALPTPKTATKPRRFFDDLNQWAKINGGAGLGYLTFADSQPGGPLAKKLDASRLAKLQQLATAHGADTLFFVCGEEQAAYELAGKARLQLGQLLQLVSDQFAFCWVTDFPMFFRDSETKKIDFGHNPFTMPQATIEELASEEPEKILAYQYDLVCNGQELGSGAIRNHCSKSLIKCFEVAGYPPEVTEKSFGALVKAFNYGAPPHGGIALGMERIVMIIAQAINLREVTMFPLNQQARDLMMNAPAVVETQQLKELGLQLLLDNQ